MKDLRISLIQTPLFWEDSEANRSMLENKVQALTGTTDLILLPEMFSTGFSMKPKVLAEKMDGPTMAWLARQAEATESVVAGSLIIEEEGNYFNRLVWMRPDGSYEHYDKRHLFRMGEEHHHYTGGEKRLVVNLNGWKILPLVCYDLRFPVWSRNQNDSESGAPEFDLMFYVANWPAVRSHPWSTLLLARAIENQVYVAGLNRIGEDGNGVAHSGNSAVIDPKGNVISTLQPNEEGVETVTLSRSELEAFREKFPVGRDADRFQLG